MHIAIAEHENNKNQVFNVLEKQKPIGFSYHPISNIQDGIETLILEGVKLDKFIIISNIFAKQTSEYVISQLNIIKRYKEMNSKAMEVILLDNGILRKQYDTVFGTNFDCIHFITKLTVPSIEKAIEGVESIRQVLKKTVTQPKPVSKTAVFTQQKPVSKQAPQIKQPIFNKIIKKQPESKEIENQVIAINKDDIQALEKNLANEVKNMQKEEQQKVTVTPLKRIEKINLDEKTLAIDVKDIDENIAIKNLTSDVNKVFIDINQDVMSNKHLDQTDIDKIIEEGNISIKNTDNKYNYSKIDKENLNHKSIDEISIKNTKSINMESEAEKKSHRAYNPQEKLKIDTYLYNQRNQEKIPKDSIKILVSKFEHKNPRILILGDRRSGKTTLAYKLLKYYSSENSTLGIDLDIERHNLTKEYYKTLMSYVDNNEYSLCGLQKIMQDKSISDCINLGKFDLISSTDCTEKNKEIEKSLMDVLLFDEGYEVIIYDTDIEEMENLSDICTYMTDIVWLVDNDTYGIENAINLISKYEDLKGLQKNKIFSKLRIVLNSKVTTGDRVWDRTLRSLTDKYSREFLSKLDESLISEVILL